MRQTTLNQDDVTEGSFLYHGRERRTVVRDRARALFVDDNGATRAACAWVFRLLFADAVWMYTRAPTDLPEGVELAYALYVADELADELYDAVNHSVGNMTYVDEEGLSHANAVSQRVDKQGGVR